MVIGRNNRFPLDIKWKEDETMDLFNICLLYAALGMIIASCAVRLHSRLLQVFGNLVLCVAMVSMIGVTVSMVLPKDGKYEAVRDGEIVTYSKCYKEHGQNVCEGAFNSKVVVEDYWKK